MPDGRGKIREGGLGCYQPLVTKIQPCMVQNLYSERDLFIKLLLGEKIPKNMTISRLGEPHIPKSDEFSEKFQRGEGSFSIQKFILQNLDL